MNEVHCSPSETDVEKAVHTPCTHRHSPDDKTITTRANGTRKTAEENWKAKVNFYAGEKTCEMHRETRSYLQIGSAVC